jgi:hypothetical protein
LAHGSESYFVADPNRALFESVVLLLAPVLDELVFVGGCTTGLANDVKTFVDEGVNGLRARKETLTIRLQAQFAGMTPQEITREWWTMAPNNIDSWVKDYMRSSKEHLALGDDETQWPRARSQQTAWSMHAYSMARVFMNVGLNRRIGDGDVHDSHHFAAACYAQTFVTHDGVFRETLAQVPNLPVEVLDFNQFAQRIGVAPH